MLDCNSGRVALPSGGRDSLLAGCNCKVWEAWESVVAEAQNHDKDRGAKTVTGVHGSVTWIHSKTANAGMEK